ncbi:Disease resistance protein [Citrus sinensis]|nr:Disease resistance protein [Citrus sinensis]
MSILNEITDALKNGDVNTLGIYGIGGIGKTTLAKEVARRAENDKLFDQVVFSEVSESQDIRKIQREIADKLGLKFDEESESEKRILVILDNIWGNLDLKAAGIPHGDDHRGCKVLLTARTLDTLSRKMDSQKNFSVSDYVEGNELKEVARDVAKECAGLPVAIVTDALEQLRRPSSTNLMNVQPTAYKAIKLSYDKLAGEELKNIFLLIGYTAIASIDDLLMYGMGMGLFQGVNKMQVARARAHALVHKLKACCMLLDHISQKKGLFSMHDVVRDVAISIASTEQNVFSATEEQVSGCREWSDESAIKLYTSIVLHDVKTNLLPEAVECPQLELLYIRADKESSSLTIPNKFFERMIQVRVINLSYMNLLSLPSSLGLLSNLQTLSLYNCKLLDITVIRDLKKLEVLCLRGSDIKRLPVEVGELTLLRLLDLRDCRELEIIPPNVLSKLSHLEELYMGPRSFDKWEVEVEGVKNASLHELKHLISLELQIQDVNTLPRGLFLEKLERYKILIGGVWGWEYADIWCREFKIDLDSKIRLKDGLILKLQGIEDLWLSDLEERDVNYFVNELDKVGPSQLKHLYIRGSHLTLNPAESKV